MRKLLRAIRSNRGSRGTAAAAALLFAAGCSPETPRPARRAVEIRAFVYEPQTLSVAVGDTVIWINHDPVPHTATGPRGRWDTGPIGANASARRVADRPDTGEYVCAYHPNIRATLVVRARR
jgi:plastocyanin